MRLAQSTPATLPLSPGDEVFVVPLRLSGSSSRKPSPEG
jgi:hypothetical protein